MKLEFPYFDGTNWNWYQAATENFVNTKVFDINSNTSGQLNINRLNNYPNSTNAFLRGDGNWTLPSFTLTGAVTGTNSGSSIATILNSSQTMAELDLAFNWPFGNLDVYNSSFSHYLVDSSNPTGSSPYFVEKIQAGIGTKKRYWSMYFLPGQPNIPSPSFGLSYYHNTFTGSYANGVSVFSITYKSGPNPPTFLATFQGDVQASGRFYTSYVPIYSFDLTNKLYVDNKIFNIDNNTSGNLSISRLANYPNSTNSFLRGDGLWVLPHINNLQINGQVNLATFGLITTGNISAQTGTLIANNLESYNSGSIVVNSPLNLNGNILNNIKTISITNDGSVVPISFNCTSATSSNIGILAQLSGANKLFIGYNPNTDLTRFRTYSTTTGISFNLNGHTTDAIRVKYNVENNAYVGINKNTPTCELDVIGDVSISGTLKVNTIGTYSNTNLSINSPITLNNNKIINVADPTTAQGVATRNFVDNKDINSFPVSPTGLGLSGYPLYNVSSITATSLYVTEIYTSSNYLRINNGLIINGTYGYAYSSYGYLNSSGDIGVSGSSTIAYPYSLRANGRISASEFNAISSIKKKNVLAQGIELEKEVIKIIKNTEFFKYEYKDKIAEKGIRYGVIAEELGKTLPDYIDYENMEYIPNIMQTGESNIFKKLKNEYTITLPSNIEITANNKKLKLINSKNRVIEVSKFDIIGKRTLKITSKEEITKDIFVYGTYEQCPSVASKVTELALIAVKNLLTRIETLEKKGL